MKSDFLRRAFPALALLATAQCLAAEGVRVAQTAAGHAHDALFAVDFAGERGTAVGAHGSIVDSADNGRHWTAVNPAPTTLGLLDVAVSVAGDIAVGQKGLILMRAPGSSWQPVSSGTQERLLGVSQNASGRAAIVGAFGLVLASDDGGRRWRAIAPDWSLYADPGVQPHLYAVHVDAAGVITVGGEFGLILRSADAGSSWSLLHKGDASIFGLELRADGVGYAVGQSGTVLRTADGGASWTAVDARTKAHLLAVRSSPGGRVVATAMRDFVVSRDDGSSWQRIRGQGLEEAWLGDVAPVRDSNRFVAVGHSGEILQIGVGNRPGTASTQTR